MNITINNGKKVKADYARNKLRIQDNSGAIIDIAELSPWEIARIKAALSIVEDEDEDEDEVDPWDAYAQYYDD